MRYVRIEAGVVANAEEWESAPDVDGVTYVQSDTAHIGATWDGTTFTNPAYSEPVPAVISRLQALQELNNAGLYASVTGYMATAALDQQIYWANAADFHRDHPVLARVATGLGLTDAQIDALFIAAAKIT